MHGAGSLLHALRFVAAKIRDSQRSVTLPVTLPVTVLDIWLFIYPYTEIVFPIDRLDRVRYHLRFFPPGRH
jgi:hypothetical protein